MGRPRVERNQIDSLLAGMDAGAAAACALRRLRLINAFA